MTTTDSPLDALLKRPLDQRIREYQYRFAQSAIFGLPVLALHFFGPLLGAGAERWSVLMQLLLTAWIIYIGAAGMIFEGLLTLRASFTGDLLTSVIATAFFAFSCARVIYQIASAAGVSAPTYFHLTVILLACWTGMKWAWLSRHSSTSRQSSPSSP